MKPQKGTPGEGAGNKRGEGPSEAQPPAEETIVPGEVPRQPITDEARLKEAQAADEDTFSEDEEDNYCPICGCTGGCTCGNSEPYSGHPWVFD
jgi:heterodisulfide reductase subunit C